VTRRDVFGGRLPGADARVGGAVPGHEVDAARSVPALLAALVAALDAVDDHVVVLDEAGRVVHANVAWQRFALDNGWEESRWVGMDYLAGSAADVGSLGVAGLQVGGDDPVTDGIREVLAGRRVRYATEYDCHAPDELRWFRLRATRIDVPGVGAVVTHTDVTHRRLAERALEHGATHDELTGLANRSAVQQAVAEMLRGGLVVGILSLRLEAIAGDGRPLPDAAIVETAELLAELFPAPAVTARYTHDRFVVVAAGMTEDGLGLSETIVTAALRGRLRGAHGVDVAIAARRTTDDAAARRALDGPPGDVAGD
jgi:GGDEF domain-containing protein